MVYLDEPTASPGVVASNIWKVLSHPLAAHPLTRSPAHPLPVNVHHGAEADA